MTSLNLYNQYQYNPMLQNASQPVLQQSSGAFMPNMQGLPPSMQGVDYNAVKSHIEARSKDNAIVQATKDYDVTQHPGVLGKNFLLCLLMSMGFTAGTNYLMSSKNIANNVSNLQDFQNTRLYRAGGFLDKKVGQSALGKFLGNIGSKVKNITSKVPVPNFVKEIGSKIKVGSIAVLDKQGMYSIGKGAEALNEAIEYLSQVDVKQIKSLGLGAAEADVIKVLKDFRLGNIRGPVAYQKIAPYFEKISAEKLAKLTVGEVSKLDKLFTTTPNINLALHKARFFNGMYNKAQGPIAKMMQKFTSLVGEASGGGVLGGKMALLMNAVGLMTGFNAASNAEKGDKLKAFMEDYIGFTLGSYLMSFFVGTWFNKFLGVSELGLDKNAIAAVGKRLGIDMSQGRLQDAVIAYNRDYKQFRGLNKVASDFRNGKISFSKAISKAQKYNVQNASNAKSSLELLTAIEKTLKGRTEADFASLRSELKNAMKSKLTLKSIFKETEHNSGSFLSRLGRYIVQKPLALIGRAMSVGRYDLVHGSKFSLKSMLKWTKRFGGGLGRAMFVMFVLVEPFRKGFMKLSHAIFGKPKKSALDEDKNEKEIQETKNIQQAVANQNNFNQGLGVNQPVQQSSAIPSNSNQINSYAQTNILKQMLENPPSKTVSASSPINDTIVPESLNRDNVPELVRTYIPSPMPSAAAMQSDPREAEVERALLKADAAEKAAMRFLH